MSKRQSRRSISVCRRTYEELRGRSRREGRAMSAIVEEELDKLLRHPATAETPEPSAPEPSEPEPPFDPVEAARAALKVSLLQPLQRGDGPMNLAVMTDQALADAIVRDVVVFEDDLRWQEVRPLRGPEGARVFRGAWGHLVAQVLLRPDGTAVATVRDDEARALLFCGANMTALLLDDAQRALATSAAPMVSTTAPQPEPQCRQPVTRGNHAFSPIGTKSGGDECAICHGSPATHPVTTSSGTATPLHPPTRAPDLQAHPDEDEERGRAQPASGEAEPLEAAEDCEDDAAVAAVEDEDDGDEPGDHALDDGEAEDDEPEPEPDEPDGEPIDRALHRIPTRRTATPSSRPVSFDRPASSSRRPSPRPIEIREGAKPGSFAGKTTPAKAVIPKRPEELKF